MTPFIDIHSHIIPGIDDGTCTLNDAIEMVEYAANNGISHMVMTPHIHHGRYDNDKQSISRPFIHLQQAIEKKHIPIHIAYSGEVRIGVEMMEMLIQNKIPFLGQYKEYRVILLEFPHSQIPPGSDRLVNWLIRRKIKPIIAHPERNKDLHKDFTKLVPFLKAGCLLQVTAASLTGKFGQKSQQLSQLLIENKWAHFIATDAHNMKHRPPELREAHTFLVDILGKIEARKLFYDNPWSIVKNKF